MAASALSGVLPIAAASLWLLLAGLVLRAAPGRLFNVLFFALYVLSATKSLAEAGSAYVPLAAPQAAWFPGIEVWIPLAFFAAAGMLPLFVWFVSVFPRPHGPFARSNLAVAALFVPPVFVAALLAFTLLAPGGGSLNILDLVRWFNWLVYLYTGYALLVLVKAFREAKEAAEKNRTRLILWAFGLINVASWAVAGLQELGSGLQDVFVSYVTPAAELVAAALMAYAITKYQLLGVEILAKRTVKRSFTVGSMAAVFFVTKGTTEEVFEAYLSFVAFNYLLAAVVAGILFVPVEKASRRLIARFFPGVTEDEEYLVKRKLDIYREQIAVAMADGALKEKELRMLALLRKTLGISEEDARAVETQVNAFLPSVMRATPAEAAK